jgi:ParB-like chromosome segregation protein Spo0J
MQHIRTQAHVLRTLKGHGIPEKQVPAGIENQPVNGVRWVHLSEIRPNGWNPNFTARPELRLLKLSILRDGWCCPLVVTELEEGGYEINEGEHRWLIANDPEVYALTKGYVPVVILAVASDVERMGTTIRFNRARGNHKVGDMAELVNRMVTAGIEPEELETILGMEDEEISRFLDRGDMLKRGSSEDFNRGWKPG